MHPTLRPFLLSLLGLLLLAPALRAQGPGPGPYATAITTLPYTISTQGSYYLAANLTGVTGQDGIRINASNVSLNLNGRSLRGVTGSRCGITVTAINASEITIQNGTLSNWGLGGIDGSVAAGFHIEGVVVSNCALFGMRFGARTRVERCTARSNAGNGILVGDDSSLTSCVATANVGAGIFTGSNSRVESCTATTNEGDGIIASDGSIVRDSVAATNVRTGIRAGDNSLVVDCNSSRNQENGIAVVHNTRVTGCTASRNGNGANPSAVGILAEGSTNVLERNSTVSNGIGYRALGLQNFISSNTSQSEVGFSVNPGNVVGPIVTAAEIALAKNPTSNFDL